MFKSHASFNENKPVKNLPYNESELEDSPELEDFNPKIGILDKVMKSRIIKKNKIAEEEFKQK
jgi:hypothetical protein